MPGHWGFAQLVTFRPLGGQIWSLTANAETEIELEYVSEREWP